MSLTTFRRIPRVALAHTPTPLTRIDFAWSTGRLHVKRDDLTGSAMTGNKVRKLEYLLADARKAGADTLVTCGGVQSNCARALAVAAAQTGAHSVLVLFGREPAELDGNYLIDRLVGAEIQFFPEIGPDRRDAALEHVAQAQARLGRRPYVVPYGGSSDVGALGYVRAALEIQGQLNRMAEHVAHVVVPLASGGTYAGLLLGALMLRASWRPIGAFVEGTAETWRPRLVDYANQTAERFRLGVQVEAGDIQLLDARGAGYGQPTEPELLFIAEFARRTGLIVDPVYTGRSLYFLDQSVRSGQLTLAGDVLFVHTGGIFGLFPHAAQLAGSLAKRCAPALAISA